MLLSRRQCCLALGLAALSLVGPEQGQALESLEWGARGAQGGQGLGQATQRATDSIARGLGQTPQSPMPQPPKQSGSAPPKRKAKKPTKRKTPPK
jgi:hypothetical protein